LESGTLLIGEVACILKMCRGKSRKDGRVNNYGLGEEPIRTLWKYLGNKKM